MQIAITQIPRSYVIAAPLLMVWTVYFILLAVGGFSPEYNGLLKAVLYQVLFVVLVTVPILAMPLGKPGAPAPAYARMDRIMATTGLVLSTIAVVCLFIDKMQMGIDYSKGVCLARVQMTLLGEARQGIHSPFSFIGNLLSTSFFVSVAVALTRDVSRREFWGIVLSAGVLLMAFSTIAASRSTIMLFGAFVVAALCLRFILGARFARPKFADVAVAFAVIAVASWFMLSMFHCRATASGMSDTQYMQSFETFLGAKISAPEHVVPAAAATRAAEIGGLVGISTLYITHSAYTFAAILSMGSDEARVMFVYPLVLLSKIGLVSAPAQEWELAGRFVSMPGALWHDYGTVGLVLGALLLGASIAFSARQLRSRTSNVVLLGVSSALIVIALLSSLNFAGDFATFPFICFAFVLVPLLARIFSRAQKTRQATIGISQGTTTA